MEERQKMKFMSKNAGEVNRYRIGKTVGVLKMTCKIVDLRSKEVISVKDGTRLGCVSDVEIDTCTAQLVAIVIYGRMKLFGLLGREEDIIIRWCDIEVIGEDTILVHYEMPRMRKKKPHSWRSVLGA